LLQQGIAGSTAAQTEEVHTAASRGLAIPDGIAHEADLQRVEPERMRRGQNRIGVRFGGLRCRRFADRQLALERLEKGSCSTSCQVLVC
jgi:hypothetical protein